MTLLVSRPMHRRPSRTRALLVAAAIVVASVGATSTMAGAASDDTYVVRPGDTLSQVALQEGVSITDLRDWNDLSNVDRIRSGQVLLLEPESRAYVVASGDTLSEIAERFDTTTTELVAMNDLGNRHNIRSGITLRVPAAGSRTVLLSGTGSLRRVSDTDPVAGYPDLPARLANSAERSALIPIFEYWAEANDVPVDLLMAVAWQESGWNQEAESSVGALGIGQLMPVTAEWIASDLIGQEHLDRTVPEDNIRMSARYLDYLLGRFDTEDEAIGAYFQGPTSVASGEWLDVTGSYVANVQAQRSLFGGPDRS